MNHLSNISHHSRISLHYAGLADLAESQTLNRSSLDGIPGISSTGEHKKPKETKKQKKKKTKTKKKIIKKKHFYL
jgi:hypothetical protein